VKSAEEIMKIARDFVDDHRDSLSPALIADAQLLVSEIVTNAVLHGRPDITLAMRLEPPGLGVVVTDSGDALPQVPSEAPDPGQASGRGLLIVAAIASAWGVSPADPPPGKAVWFDLHPPQTPIP
jgi:anti-sigma regulatory factor (Ser/Thr protein kinase)